MIRVEPASEAEIRAFHGGQVPATMNGYAMKVGADIVAMFGLERHKGYRIAYSSIKDGGRKYRKSILKCGKMLVDMIAACRVPVYAVRDNNEPTSDAFLRHLGFEQLDGEVYLWRQRQQ